MLSRGHDRCFLNGGKKLYGKHFQCDMLYGSGTWAMKTKNMQRMKRMGKITIRCIYGETGVILKAENQMAKIIRPKNYKAENS